jgi:hypothetical protein
MHVDFADGNFSTTHLFVVELDIISPTPRFRRHLHVWSLRELEESNPLTHVGARVAFAVSRKYLVNILSDPTKEHDFPFLYVESVTQLREVPMAPTTASAETP